MGRYRWLISLLVLTLPLTACEKEQTPAAAKPEHAASPAAEAPDKTAQTLKAVATLEPTEGNTASGTVTFTAAGEGVRIVAEAEGLTPGRHGFHIHEHGDCSQNAEAAGGHFNPDGSPHGAPDNPVGQRHVGDLGNLEADAGGRAHYERTDQVISLDGEDSIVGKAVIVHAAEDDFQSQPTGAAGSRLACGIIQARE